MKRQLRQLLQVLAVFFVVIAFSAMSPAQTSRGTVTGTVKDPSGAVVPNAQVKLTETSTNVTRETRSNDVGIYRFDAVNLGEYSISITAAGFSGGVVNNVVVQAGRIANIDFDLKVGSVESVVVEASGVEVLVKGQEVRGGTISSRALANLPIAGQNSLNLITTVPGVVPTNIGVGGGIASINGARPRSNNFMLDGVENNDISVAGPGVVPTNNDAIAEVSVQTSNFSAEFGRSGGGVINQITKSGTNDLHGTIAWVYRSQRLNASTRAQRRNKLASPFLADGVTPRPLKPSFKENIPAITIGGPVTIPKLYDGKNRTFWFLGMQWDRYSDGGSTATFTVPTDAGVAVLQPLAATCPNVAFYLNFLGGLRGSSVASSGVSNISIALPTGNAAIAATSCGGGLRTGQVVQVGPVTRSAPTIFLANNHVARFDHRITEKQQMSFRWLWDDQVQTPDNIGILPDFDTKFTNRSMGGAFSHTYSLSQKWTNELRVNYQRVNLGFPLANSSGLGFTLPEISVSGISSMGLSAVYPQGRLSNSYQYQDTVTWVQGKHQVRMGVDFLRQLARQVAPFNGRGQIGFATSPVNAGAGVTSSISALANFIDNYGGPSTNVASISFGSGLYRPNLFRWTLFVQDSWRMTPDFTLNIGLRYENFGQPANIFEYPAFVGLNPGDILKKDKIRPDNNNFGPSVGFAWNPKYRSGILGAITGDGKMVIRGGYQVTYDTWFNNLLSNMAAGSPNALTNLPFPSTVTTTTPRGRTGVLGVLAGAAPTPITDLSTSASQFPLGMRNPYTHRWSLGVQRELPGRVVFEASYVGAVSRKLFRTWQANPFGPNATLTGPKAPTATDSGRLVGALGSRQHRFSDGNSNYNALQIEARKAYSETAIGAFQLQSSFTWSKNLDQMSETFGTNSAPQNPSIQPVFGEQWKNIDYGPADNDRKFRWVNTLVWDIKGPKKGVLGHILGGWQIAGVTSLQSGTPFTPTNGVDRDFDGSTLGDRPDIGNWNAPINTRARVVGTSVCATGLQNPEIGTGTGVGCVTRNDVRWIQVNGYNLPTAQTARRNNVVTDGFTNVDTNILKTFRLSERFKFEYRAEIFNILNLENFNQPTGNRVIATTNPGNFLNKNLFANTGSRTMRMGLKLIF